MVSVRHMKILSDQNKTSFLPILLTLRNRLMELVCYSPDETSYDSIKDIFFFDFAGSKKRIETYSWEEKEKIKEHCFFLLWFLGLINRHCSSCQPLSIRTSGSSSQTYTNFREYITRGKDTGFPWEQESFFTYISSKYTPYKMYEKCRNFENTGLSVLCLFSASHVPRRHISSAFLDKK